MLGWGRLTNSGILPRAAEFNAEPGHDVGLSDRTGRQDAHYTVAILLKCSTSAPLAERGRAARPDRLCYRFGMNSFTSTTTARGGAGFPFGSQVYRVKIHSLPGERSSKYG